MPKGTGDSGERCEDVGKGPACVSDSPEVLRPSGGELERKTSEGLRDRACEEGRGRQIGAPKLKSRLEAETQARSR